MLALQILLEEDKYKSPPSTKWVDGFDTLEKCLELMRKGVSALVERNWWLQYRFGQWISLPGYTAIFWLL
ncbi:hypothetical protein V1505DRAFT_374419 [Lipomyces doorenjongii]